jgi:glycosyltransferase involved in cell wall biosynthesis
VEIESGPSTLDGVPGRQEHRLRILLAGSYPPDPRLGSPKLLLRLGAEFQRMGHEVRFVLLDVLPRWAQQYRVAWFLFPLLVAAEVLRAQRRGTAYDVIDVSGGDGWVIAVLKRWLRLHGVVICRSHGWEHEDYRIRVRAGVGPGRWKRGLLMRVARLPMVAISARRSDAIIVGSSPVRAFAVTQGWKSASRIFVIACGLDPAYLTANHSAERRGFLYAGSWLDRKGVVYLAEAYRLARQHGCDAPLSIVGFGQSAKEVVKAFEAGVRADIRISEALRVLDEQALIGEYQKHEILVFPSLYEGFGMVFLEAMAAGLAVIATPVGGVVDLIRDEENGVIVPLADSEALADAIIDLWSSPDKRRSLGEAGRLTACQYTWERIAQQTLACYLEVVGVKESRP